MTEQRTDAGTSIDLRIPSPYRCAVCLTFDTDMAGGYSPPEQPFCHGRTAPFVADSMRRLMDAAEQFDVRLHFFKIANGLEQGNDWSVYREALERGHDIDSHTYSHLNLAYTADPGELDADLRRANVLLKDSLDIDPVVLRGPGGYLAGKLPPANRQVILKNGFRYVSGEFNAHAECAQDTDIAQDALRHPPFRYADGLVEIPIHGWTDRAFFDSMSSRRAALEHWRAKYAHKPVPDGWTCPWTEPDAMARFIDLHKTAFDAVYKNQMLYNLTCHPYSLYLHDRENVFLREFITHIHSKPEPVWIGTLRDAARDLLTGDKSGEQQPCCT